MSLLGAYNIQGAKDLQLTPRRLFTFSRWASSATPRQTGCFVTRTVNASGQATLASDEPPIALDLPESMSSYGRLTKIVATIGPTSNTEESFGALARAGLNVARLNMSHGDHSTHGAVVDLIKRHNATAATPVAMMVDTKGPEVRSGDLAEPIECRLGESYVFTITEGCNGTDGRISVNYDDFITDVEIGDILLVDGGIMSFKVVSKNATDVACTVHEEGVFKSRRHLNVRGKSATLPSITDKDWLDIDFGIEHGVDYYALSFVRDAEVIYELKRYLSQRGATIGVLAKIESADAVSNLDEILDAVDGAMVARGDLGAELPFEQVPYWQQRIINGCRSRGKPVIVATNMLESMIKNPTPTRAEVSDIAIAVRQGSDAVMLSGETAYGSFPSKALQTMSQVSLRAEESMRGQSELLKLGGEEESGHASWIMPAPRGVVDTSMRFSEMFAYHAATMANTMGAPIMVFTRSGNMPALLSHYRPKCGIFALTEKESVARRLGLYHSVKAVVMKFDTTAEGSFDKAMQRLLDLGMVVGGQVMCIVQSGRRPIWRQASTHVLQARNVPSPPRDADSSDE